MSRWSGRDCLHRPRFRSVVKDWSWCSSTTPWPTKPLCSSAVAREVRTLTPCAQMFAPAVHTLHRQMCLHECAFFVQVPRVLAPCGLCPSSSVFCSTATALTLRAWRPWPPCFNSSWCELVFHRCLVFSRGVWVAELLVEDCCPSSRAALGCPHATVRARQPAWPVNRNCV